MSHTPGPWQAKPMGGRILLNGSNCYEVTEVFNDEGGFNPADIHLMAAAPELLSACKKLIDFGQEEALSNVNEEFSCAWEEACRAVAKAKGDIR